MADRSDGEFGELIRRHGTRFTAPSGLAARIGAALDAAETYSAEMRAAESCLPPRAMRRAGVWRPLALAASFVLAIVLSSGTTWYVTASDGQDRLAEQLVDSHVRSLQADHLIDVVSSDRHTVKPWFDGKLDLSPPVVDLAEKGFPLIGGRLDYLDNHPVAALVYRHGQHVINVFVWTQKAGRFAPAPPEDIQGYNLRHWQQGDFTFWAVSDAEGTALDDFVKEFRSASG